jgi:hypothetical protein
MNRKKGGAHSLEALLFVEPPRDSCRDKQPRPATLAQAECIGKQTEAARKQASRLGIRRNEEART